MEKRVLNYRIIIEKEQYDSGSFVYVSYCPTLGISDYGDSVEKAKQNIKEAIKCHVEGLVKTGDYVPVPDTQDVYISQAEILAPKNIKLAF